jgi:phosphate starvation-inducible protein PhoH
MLVTWLVMNSRMVITGDLHQTDIVNKNGLYDLINKLNNFETNLIKLIRFENEDIERSEIVKTVIAMYDDKRIVCSEKNNLDIKNNTFITKQIISPNFDIFFDESDL